MEPELKILQDHLLANCLCTLPRNVSPTLLLCCFSAARRSDAASMWSVDQILTQITCLQLICEKTIKQSADPFRCRMLTDLRNDITRRQNDVIEYLLALADDSDRYIRFAAARALAIFFLILRTRLDRAWIDKLVENLQTRLQPHRVLFSLDVLRCIVEWKDFEEHILEDCFPQDEMPPASCNVLSMHAERVDSSEMKCLCVEALAPKWTRIVNQFTTLIRDQSTSAIAYRSCVICFLSLWESIISVKANLSISDTKPFYCALDSSVSLLSNSVPSLVWKHILNLFNEVLCYGNTLALQHDLAGEPCSLAHVILRHVKDRRLLRTIPHITGNGGFGGGVSNEGDKFLLKKVVLMILKAVAVTIKEAKYDSSSDSSIGSEQEDDDDHEMDMICRSIFDVLKKLDTFVKENEDFHPSTRLASWIVHLFIDQDDFLIESMVCCVDVARVLCYRNNNFLPELRKDLNPSETFLTFLNATSFNVDLLVDYLKSNETCFLLYVLNFLKYLRDQWGEFIETCKYELPAVGKLFSDLRTTIQREVEVNHITYNISPVLSLLIVCEQRIRTPE